MAEFTIMSQKEAPQRPHKTGPLKQRMAEYEGYIKQLGARTAGCLTPGERETARGLALRVTRAGTRLGKDVTAWVADGNVYFTAK